MAKAWITNATHLLDESGKVPARLTRRGIVRTVGAVITRLTARDGVAEAVRVSPCNRRPGRQACPGWIRARVEPDGRLAWQCPECGDHGWVSDWQRTPWDQGWRANLPTIHRVRFRAGLIRRLAEAGPLPVRVLEGEDLPREVVVAIHDDALLAAAGEYGDSDVGDPIQIDDLVIDHPGGSYSIRVFNRAIMLFTTNEAIFVRVHRVCSIIERTLTQAPVP